MEIVSWIGFEVFLGTVVAFFMAGSIMEVTGHRFLNKEVDKGFAFLLIYLGCGFAVMGSHLLKSKIGFWLLDDNILYAMSFVTSLPTVVVILFRKEGRKNSQ